MLSEVSCGSNREGKLAVQCKNVAVELKRKNDIVDHETRLTNLWQYHDKLEAKGLHKMAAKLRR